MPPMDHDQRHVMNICEKHYGVIENKQELNQNAMYTALKNRGIMCQELRNNTIMDNCNW